MSVDLSSASELFSALTQFTRAALKQAEMEVSLLSRECLGERRLGGYKTLRREVAAWNRRNDCQRRCIDRKWRVSDAHRVLRYHGITTIRAEH